MKGTALVLRHQDQASKRELPTQAVSDPAACPHLQLPACAHKGVRTGAMLLSFYMGHPEQSDTIWTSPAVQLGGVMFQQVQAVLA